MSDVFIGISGLGPYGTNPVGVSAMQDGEVTNFVWQETALSSRLQGLCKSKETTHIAVKTIRIDKGLHSAVPVVPPELLFRCAKSYTEMSGMLIRKRAGVIYDVDSKTYMWDTFLNETRHQWPSEHFDNLLTAQARWLLQTLLEDKGLVERQCKFVRSWSGRCNQLIYAPELCLEHIKKKCHCGKQAMRECSTTGSLFVCGAPLCEACCCRKHG